MTLGMENIKSGGIESVGESTEMTPEEITESPESILAQENLGLEREIGSNERLADAYAENIASGTEELIKEGGEEVDPELASFAEEADQTEKDFGSSGGFFAGLSEAYSRRRQERYEEWKANLGHEEKPGEYMDTHPEEYIKWDVICGRCHKKGHRADECPKNR